MAKELENEVVDGSKEIFPEELSWRLKWQCAGKSMDTLPGPLLRKLYDLGLFKLSDEKRGICFCHDKKMSKVTDIHIPRGMETMSFLVMGSAGSGKTSGAINTMLESVLDRGDKTVIFDYKGDFVEALAGLKDVHLIAPWDARSERIVIGNECLSTADAEMVASACIKPNPNEKDPFWTKAAQAVLSSVIKCLMADHALTDERFLPGTKINIPDLSGLRPCGCEIGQYVVMKGDTPAALAAMCGTTVEHLRTLNSSLTWDNLFTALSNMDHMQELIDSTLAGTLADEYVDSHYPDKASSILSLVKQHMAWIPEAVQAWGSLSALSVFRKGRKLRFPGEYTVKPEDTVASIAEKFGMSKEALISLNTKPVFNLRQWLRDDSEKGVVIFKYTEARPMLSESIITVFMELLIAECLSLGEPKERDSRRIWFFLDELPQLPKIRNLPKLLQAGRSFGCCAVVGTQDIASLENKYGLDATRVITNNLNTSIIYRTGEPAAAEWASKRLGNYVERSHKTSGFRGGFEVTEASTPDNHIRNTVEPDQIRTLPVPPQAGAAIGYVKLPGNGVSVLAFSQARDLPKKRFPAEVEAAWVADSGEKVPQHLKDEMAAAAAKAASNSEPTAEPAADPAEAADTEDKES